MNQNHLGQQKTTDSEPEPLPFGDIIEDVEFVNSANKLAKSLQQLTQHMDSDTELLHKEELDPMDAVDRDLFLLYAINSLIWVRLKLEGQDPSAHPVKHHLNKVRELMQRKQVIVDRRKRPALDTNVAKRFIRNGLWQPNAGITDKPLNKKIKFQD